MLTALYEAGTLKAGVTLELFAQLAVGSLPLNYSALFKILAVLGAALYAGSVMRVPGLRSLLQPMTLAQHVTVSSAFIGVIVVPVILGLVGLGRELRWHVESVYLLAATFGIVGRLGLWGRSAALGLAAIGAVLQLLTIYAMPIAAPAFLRLPIPEVNPRPSAIPVGSEVLAFDIARHEKRVVGRGQVSSPSFSIMSTQDPTSDRWSSTCGWQGVPLASRIAGFYDRAIDVGNFFDAKYLVEGTGRSGEWNDPENRRYRLLAQNLPVAFRNVLVEVSDLEARFGRFKVYYVPRERITRDMVLTTIETGRRLETVPVNLVLWDAQRIIWRARFEAMPGNVSLRQEIDEFLQRISPAPPDLRATNRQVLQSYVTQIQEVRRMVDTVPPAAPEPVRAPARARRAGRR